MRRKGRGHGDKEGRVVTSVQPTQASPPPLTHLCSRPARAPWGARFATVTLKGKGDIKGRAMSRLASPEVLGDVTTQCHYHPPLGLAALGVLSCP